MEDRTRTRKLTCLPDTSIRDVVLLTQGVEQLEDVEINAHSGPALRHELATKVAP